MNKTWILAGYESIFCEETGRNCKICEVCDEIERRKFGGDE